MKKIMFNDKYGLTEAVLSGRKTQTRRIYKDPVNAYGGFEIDGNTIIEYDANGNPIVTSPRYKVGEVVAVAQSYNEAISKLDWINCLIYKNEPGWTNKMFVRADLMTNHIRITGVRIERLQDISDEDCIKEGISPYYYGEEAEKIECGFAPDGFSFDGIDCHYPTPREAYAAMIDRVSDKGTWASNPYVFVYDFELVD